MKKYIRIIKILRREWMVIKFWGVRGSVPSPGKETSYFGGNTTCVTVESDSTLIIIDGGTGIRNVSSVVEKNSLKNIHIILTHYHWDHLQGLPFFLPLFNPSINIDIYGKRNVSKVLSTQMKQPFFPADYKNLPSKINHKKIKPFFNIGDISVETIENNHPSGCVGLKLIKGNKCFTFITDNEINAHSNQVTTQDQFVDFIRGSSLFVHDAQYTDEEIKKKRGWGHSTYNEVVAIAEKANCKNVVFTHHDPMRWDNALKEIISSYSKSKPNMHIKAAKEGMSIKL